MNIFLTGASGLVGAAFARIAGARGHRVVGISRSFTGEIEGLTTKLTMDLTDERVTTAAVLEACPDAIVNCAAISAQDACEKDPTHTQLLNVGLPACLAKLAQRVNARLVHLSSEQVFDGAYTKPYTADDRPAAINVYGRQKIAAERAVHDGTAKLAVTLRPPLLLGNSLSGRRSLHEQLFAQWSTGGAPKLYTDEFRQPCTNTNLAAAMLELCERFDIRGIFHWAGTEPISRHSLAVRIRERFRLPEIDAPLQTVTRAETPSIALRRPAYLALDLAPLARKLKTQPQTIADALAELNVPLGHRAWYATRQLEAI